MTVWQESVLRLVLGIQIVSCPGLPAGRQGGGPPLRSPTPSVERVSAQPARSTPRADVEWYEIIPGPWAFFKILQRAMRIGALPETPEGARARPTPSFERMRRAIPYGATHDPIAGYLTEDPTHEAASP